ncbi:uncharacterized protein YALI1_D29013g [Yarrowia lipolytica]|uniref:Uncharacterized protein n=1 Tax=Yarrowia lipolytica TaxID=4952 RepID=A0A1D8NFQ6_YARLL|nr:hypothetical protein YALI1_D29013g [Yarrowia lipolytica]
MRLCGYAGYFCYLDPLEVMGGDDEVDMEEDGSGGLRQGWLVSRVLCFRVEKNSSTAARSSGLLKPRTPRVFMEGT